MREPLVPPVRDLGRQVRYVEIRHPAYPQSEQPLLLLPAIDGADDDGQGDYGVDYDVALLACGVVTKNTWSTGYLANKTDEDEFLRTDRPSDGILRGNQYYYFTHDHAPDFKYNVLISFDHWPFPHGNMPRAFNDTVIPQAQNAPSLRGKAAALARDGSCRITGEGTPVEAAHLVPEANEQWFLANHMDRYAAPGSNPTGNARNLVSFRRDVYYLLDTGRLALVPRVRGNRPRLELYVFCPNEHVELLPKYHELPPQQLSGISIECILARFALTVFSPPIMPFFKGMAEYAVCLFDPGTGQWKEAQLRAPEVRTKVQIFDRSRSRSVSPRKRAYNDSQQNDDDAFSDWDSNSLSDYEGLRGRSPKRKRYNDSTSTPDLEPSSISTDTEHSECQGDGASEYCIRNRACTSCTKSPCNIPVDPGDCIVIEAVNIDSTACNRS